MRKCPHCQTDNSDDAYYCHMCGKKIRIKINRWLIVFIIFVLITCVLGLFMAYFYVDLKSDLHRCEIDVQEKELELSRLELIKKENINYKAQIEHLRQEVKNGNERWQSQIRENETEISRLKSQVPQTYKTKYANQVIYYWNGKFEKTTYRYSEAGACVSVFLWKDGYGLTEWGWIPSNCLRKY